MMLGIVPVVAAFFGLPLEVRHVTLSTGQLARRVGTEGLALLRHAPFWWCVAGIAVTGVLNLGVSFLLAFKVALRSRNVPTAGRSRIYGAIWRRLWSRPRSFVCAAGRALRRREPLRRRLGGLRSPRRRPWNIVHQTISSSSARAPRASSRITHMCRASFCAMAASRRF